MKIFSDGGVCNAVAASEPFLEGYEEGLPYFDQAAITTMIREANDGGYQVLVHAQGDLAIASVQDAFQTVLDGDENVLHHRIDHNALVTDRIASRYGEIGLLVTLFGTSAACAADQPWTEFFKQNGEEMIAGWKRLAQRVTGVVSALAHASANGVLAERSDQQHRHH